MKKILLFPVCIASIILSCDAQTPNWSDNVAAIIYSNCSNCHRIGGIGPFTLMSYQDAVDHAPNIITQVQARLMPPWKPDPNYVHFKDERKLSDDDINTIAEWITSGTPSGDLSQAPPAPVFQTGSQLPSINLSLPTPGYTVTTDIDDYRTFVIHSNFTADEFLNKIEYLPGNGSIVHHIVIFYDPTSFSWDLDQDDPLPGYQSSGVGPVNDDAQIIGAWAPGSGIFSLPSNMGIRIPAGADFGIEVHYAPGSNGQTDNTVVNLQFTQAGDIREVSVDGMLNHFDNLTDGPLFIPANTIKTFHEEFDWQYGDMSVISIFPHMHKVGKSFKAWSLDDSGDTTRLISIPEWSFHWQGFYEYQKLMHITDPSQLWAEATYDNTVNNLDNPYNPPQDIHSGEHTTDEMMIAFLAWTFYEPGDENIILDSTLISDSQNIPAINSNLSIFPNPVHDQLNITIDLIQGDKVSLELYDAAGKLMKQWDQVGKNNKAVNTVSMRGMGNGIYLLKCTSNKETQVTKIIKQ